MPLMPWKCPVRWTLFIKSATAGLVFLLLSIFINPHPFQVRAQSAPQTAPQTAPQGQVVVYLPLVSDTNQPDFDKMDGWLHYLNEYRATAALLPVGEETSYSLGDGNHARYIVKNDLLAHSEQPGNTWYTLAGDQAAQSSNLMGGSDPGASDYSAIDSWMQAPFHALGILDPALQQVGFGSYREADGGLQMAAGLDVLRGLGEIPSGVSFPIFWPGDGAWVPLTSYWGENPDPLTSCPGYTTPSGLPVLLQMGSGSGSPVVQSTSFKQGENALDTCVFTESTYANPDRTSQDLGRAILGERDAVVLIPRAPLSPGLNYSVSITVNGETYSWSFWVSATSP